MSDREPIVLVRVGRKGIPGELVLYGAFLAGVLIIYAASVVYGQRRATRESRRLAAALVTRRDVPPHHHVTSDILPAPRIVPDPAPGMGVLGIVRSEHDGADVHGD